MDISTILWREFLFFRRRWLKITNSAIISPLLYMIAFGWGVGSQVTMEGADYKVFIIPGIVALATMNTSFNAVAVRVNISRLHEKSFENYILAPVRMFSVAAGNILAGTVRGFYAALLILLTALFFGVRLHTGPAFFLICLLNSFLFASLGYFAAMIIDSHYDMNRFTIYFITPMTFLCGTFFDPAAAPAAIRNFIYLLPLTHASGSLRALGLGGSFSWISIIVLTVYALVFFALSLRANYREI